jgi:hypothetical protein
LDAIKKWFEDHNFSSHTIAVAMTTFFSLYVGNNEVKQFVDGILAVHPRWIAGFTLAISLYLKYSGSHTAEGAATLAAQQGVTATIEQSATMTEPAKILVTKE